MRGLYRTQSSHEKGGDYGYDDAVLVIKEGGHERARVLRDGTDGYGHKVYGFTRGGMIVSGGANGHLEVYDKDGNQLANLVGHEGEVWALATEGDRLDHLAGKFYGSGTLWWIIAAASGVGWGLQVPPGTLLAIPTRLGQINALVG